MPFKDPERKRAYDRQRKQDRKRRERADNYAAGGGEGGRYGVASEIDIPAADIAKIETMAGYGLHPVQMAAILGWPDTTWRDRVGDPRVTAALRDGQAKAQAAVSQSLYAKAVGDPERGITPETAAIKWWEITRAGRSERVREVDAPDDYPTMREITGLPTELKIDRLKAILRRVDDKRRGDRGRRREPGIPLVPSVTRSQEEARARREAAAERNGGNGNGNGNGREP